MKRHTLTILWAIIISGTVFLIAHQFRETPPPEKEPEFITQEQADIIVTEEDSTIEVESKSFSEHIAAGDKYFEEFYLEEAIAEYKKATEAEPNSTVALKKLAEAYLINNEPIKAEEIFLKAEKIAPNSNEIKLGLARSMLAQRKIEEAKTLIWTLPAEDPEARFYQALTLVIFNKPEEARPVFENLASSPNVKDEIREKAQIFAEKYAIFDSFTEEDPLFLKCMLAYSLTQVREFESAIPMLFEIIDEKNNYRDAWIILGYSYLQTDKIPDAIDALNQAKEMDDEKPQTLFYLGLAYFANDEIEKAIFFLEKAKVYGFEPLDILELKLAELYTIVEDFSKAASKYEKVIEINPKSIDPFVALVNIQIEELNNYERAFAYAEYAFKRFPSDPKSFNLIGKSFIYLKKYDKAKDYLTNAIKLDPQYADPYLNMGLLNEKQDLFLLSKEYYRQAYALGQKSETARTAAKGFNRVNKKLINKNYQINVSSP